MARPDVVGWTVMNYEGEEVGEVEEVVEDPDTGTTEVVVSRSGGTGPNIAPLGGEPQVLDWDTLEVDEENQILMAQVAGQKG